MSKKKVKFTECTDDQVRWGGCDDPRKVLKLGQEYEVLREEVHSWHTKIFLVSFPELGFNSACFK